MVRSAAAAPGSAPRIVHWAKYYPPHSGGMESVVASLAEGAARLGHAVEVVCFSDAPGLRETRPCGARIARCRARLKPASQPLSLRYLLAAWSGARRADIVHLHMPNFLALLAAAALPRRQVLLVHWHSDVVNKGRIGRWLEPAQRWLLRRAQCVVATSEPYARSSPQLAQLAGTLTVIPIGVPDLATRPLAAGAPAPLVGWIDGRPLVLAVGRLVDYKGFDVLVDAASRLRSDAAVLIVGDGPERAALQQRIDRLGLSRNVRLAGRLDDDELLAVFRHATLLCLPSRERAEAFGVVLAEALAHGLPVVATAIPGSGVPWVNQHGRTGFNVPVGDAEAIADACQAILGDRELHARMRAAARARYLEHFGESQAIEAFASLYRRLVSAQGGAGG